MPVGWINTAGAAAPSRGANAHESLRKVLGYTGAKIIEDACVRIPIGRDVLVVDGLIKDPAIREQAGQVLSTLARAAHRAQSDDHGVG